MKTGPQGRKHRTFQEEQGFDFRKSAARHLVSAELRRFSPDSVIVRPVDVCYHMCKPLINHVCSVILEQLRKKKMGFPWLHHGQCGISVCGFCVASPVLALVWHSLGAPSRGRDLLGGHPLWRSVFTGAGLAALGRLSLAHGAAGGVMTKLTERNTIILTAANRDVHDECCQPVGSPHSVNVSFVALPITVM